MTATELPALVDCKGLQTELGIKRASAEAIMRQLDIVKIDGLVKTFVKRSDVAALIEERTFSKDQMVT